MRNAHPVLASSHQKSLSLPLYVVTRSLRFNVKLPILHCVLGKRHVVDLKNEAGNLGLGTRRGQDTDVGKTMKMAPE